MGMKPSRITANLSHATRAALEASREKSGRSITAEIEAQLRKAYSVPASDGLLLLRIDDGFMAWLRAIDRLRFFGITFEDTAAHLLRTAMIEVSDHDAWYPHLVDQLPEPYRTANRASPRYGILKTQWLEKDRTWPFSDTSRDKK